MRGYLVTDVSLAPPGSGPGTEGALGEYVRNKRMDGETEATSMAVLGFKPEAVQREGT